MSEHYIKFENVKKSYGNGNAQINALDGVDFEINKGELCILLGSSGLSLSLSKVIAPSIF